MRFDAATQRAFCGVAIFCASGWATQALAQLGVGTVWLRTDSAGKGITLTVEACCNGGLRLVYKIPPMGGKPASTMTVNSPMDGTEVPVMIDGKPSGETMAIKRVDEHHYSTVAQINGQPFGTTKSTVSADGKTITAESVFQGSGQAIKTNETWVRQ